ncbi:MAG: hypothetical protein ACI4NZ_02160 [Candidatus Enterousia sp.]
MKIKNLFVFMTASLISVVVNASPLTEIYQTIDDQTGQPKAMAEFKYIKLETKRKKNLSANWRVIYMHLNFDFILVLSKA